MQPNMGTEDSDTEHRESKPPSADAATGAQVQGNSDDGAAHRNESDALDQLAEGESQSQKAEPIHTSNPDSPAFTPPIAQPDYTGASKSFVPQFEPETMLTSGETETGADDEKTSNVGEGTVQYLEMSKSDMEAPHVEEDPVDHSDNHPSPADHKEPVRDPGVIEFAPSPSDNGVIDVDNFDDVSDENDSEPPASDDARGDSDVIDDSLSGQTQVTITGATPGEPIDLTTSPSSLKKEAPALTEGSPDIDLESGVVPDFRSPMPTKGVVDIDEPEEEAESASELDGAKPVSSEKLISPFTPAHGAINENETGTVKQTSSEGIKSDKEDDATRGGALITSVVPRTTDDECQGPLLSPSRIHGADQDTGDDPRDAQNADPPQTDIGPSDDDRNGRNEERRNSADSDVRPAEELQNLMQSEDDDGDAAAEQEDAEIEEVVDDAANETVEQDVGQNDAGHLSSLSRLEAKELDEETEEEERRTHQDVNFVEGVPDKGQRALEDNNHLLETHIDPIASSPVRKEDDVPMSENTVEIDSNLKGDVPKAATAGKVMETSLKESVHTDTVMETSVGESIHADELIPKPSTVERAVIDSAQRNVSDEAQAASVCAPESMAIDTQDMGGKGSDSGYASSLRGLKNEALENANLGPREDLLQKEVENDSISKSPPPQPTVTVEPEESTDRNADSSHTKTIYEEVDDVKEGDRIISSDIGQHSVDTDAPNSAQGSKRGVVGHLAPMFGIQMSRPVKSGPVSFSSPPSFPRYSLNPAAVPFVPANVKGDEQPEVEAKDPSTLLSAAPATLQSSVAWEPRASPEEPETSIPSTAQAIAAKDMVINVPQMDKNAESAVAIDTKEVVQDAKKSIPVTQSPDTAPSRVTLASLEASAVTAMTTPALVRPPTKHPGPKKVSFAPTPIKLEEPSPQEKKPKSAKAGGISECALEASDVVKTRASIAPKPDAVDGKAESKKQATANVPQHQTDRIVEKQRIIQVQTDEGLRREVRNVTVAMRQGNGKVRPEKKKFTVRLTIGTGNKTKLEFFKGSEASLKLYASLDSSKDFLRVRKVKNVHVMSVAKVAPPGDEGADILIKYFLHFDSDTFEEMFALCLANLQVQPKGVAGVKKSGENSEVKQVVEKDKSRSLTLVSQKQGGTKRPADTANVAPVNKKSKLLADKKKLLDKMAALRKRKEQKGTIVKESGKRREAPAQSPHPRVARVVVQASQGECTDIGDGLAVSSGSGPKEIPGGRGIRSKANDAQRNSKDPDTGLTDLKTLNDRGVPPMKKRAAEIIEDEKVAKKARLPAHHPSKTDRTPEKSTTPEKQSKVFAADRTGVQQQGMQNSPKMVSDGKALHVRTELNRNKAENEKDVNASMSDGRISIEASVLEKTTKDLEKSEEEKKALRDEVERQTRLLQAERERNTELKTRSADAWVKVMKAFEGLQSDLAPLNTEKVDRCSEALKRCEASSSQDFFDRLHTFRPSTWTAFEDEEIGALECALRGWHNCGPAKIRSSEGCEISLAEGFADSDMRQDEVERVGRLLREGHCLLSGWIGQACPESFRTLEGSQKMLTREQLKANVDNLRKGELDQDGIRFEWGSDAVLLSEDVSEKLAVFNWCADGACVKCGWCNRRALVPDEGRFDAKSKHYRFCPFKGENWKSCVLRNAKTLGIEGDCDSLMRDVQSSS